MPESGRSLALRPLDAYLRRMSWFPRPVSPRAAYNDLRAFLSHSSREQRIGAALAVLATSIIVIEFFVDSKINTAPPKQIIYVEQWNANRTDAEIIAAQKKHQAEREAALKERQRQFQELENKFGIE
jgi:hypothetical protein